MVVCQGKSVLKGIAIGKIYLYEKQEYVLEQKQVADAEAEVARFNAMYEEYVKNPQTTKIRMFYETMEEVLPEMKIIIDNGDGVQKILPVDSFAAENTLDMDTQNTDTEK